VARMVGVSGISVLSRWERSVSVPGIVQVFRLARIYGVFPHELYEELWEQVRREIELQTSKGEPLISNCNCNEDIKK
jgi:transcriptional regulator with XRE-family HTH domain